MKKQISLAGLVLLLFLSGCSSVPVDKEPSLLSALDSPYMLEKNWQITTEKMPNRDSEGLFFAEDNVHIYTATATGFLVSLKKEPMSRWKDQIKWQVKFDSNVVSGPTLYKDQLIIGTAKGRLISLTADEAQVIWQTELSSEVMSYPVIAQQKIFTRTVDGKLYAVNANTGEVIWVVEHEMPKLSLRGAPAVLYNDDIVYVAWETGMVQAVSANSGTLLWEVKIATPKGRTDLERIVDIQSSLVLKEGRLIALGYHGKLVALNPLNGDLFFEKPFSGYRDFVVDQERIYVVDDKDVLYAFDLFSGAQQWKQAALKGRLVGDLVFYQDQLLVSDGWGYLHWLNRIQGTEEARVKHSNEYGDGNRILRIKVDGQRLILLDGDGQITQYHIVPSTSFLFRQAYAEKSSDSAF